jgi:hypothetical protein
MKIPKHSRWDHEINLIDDNVPFRKIYPLNEKESAELLVYL